MLDPKAYFQQWQKQVSAAGPVAPPPPHWAPKPEPHERSEIMQQVEEASAVKCSQIVKEKGSNFTTSVALEALNTMATKSSFKLREELTKQPAVRRLCQRVQGLVRTPPSAMSFQTLARATWNLTRFPEDARGEPVTTLGPTSKLLGSLPPVEWNA